MKTSTSCNFVKKIIKNNKDFNCKIKDKNGIFHTAFVKKITNQAYKVTIEEMDWLLLFNNTEKYGFIKIKG